MDQDYSLRFPADFDSMAAEIEDKGWFAGAVIEFKGMRIQPIFFDLVRLQQTIEDDLRRHNYFAESAIVVVDRVTKENIIAAVPRLARGEFRDLTDPTHGFPGLTDTVHDASDSGGASTAR